LWDKGEGDELRAKGAPEQRFDYTTDAGRDFQMKERLRMKITMVRQQTVVPAPAPMRLSCPVCEREVDMFTGAQAVSILGVDYQMLDHMVASGQAHSIKTISGNVWVCKDSLFSK